MPPAERSQRRHAPPWRAANEYERGGSQFVSRSGQACSGLILSASMPYFSMALARHLLQTAAPPATTHRSRKKWRKKPLTFAQHALAAMFFEELRGLPLQRAAMCHPAHAAGRRRWRTPAPCPGAAIPLPFRQGLCENCKEQNHCPPRTRRTSLP